jgi:D-beta-D-heptose 7-phosphate kinase/D-beta-D-heptose 1-phosphate adenosyltransferase
MKAISIRRASALLKAGRGSEIAVVGDVMLDQFVWGRVSRISPEAPVPVVEVTDESFHLGGAANVAANLARLGAVPQLVGVRGEDEAASRLSAVIGETGIQKAALVVDSARPTTVKTRTIAHSQQVVRADRESTKDIDPATEDEVLKKVSSALKECAALVLSDYSKGALTQRVLKRSIALARRRKIPVLVDPKLRNFPAYRRVNLITPNTSEAQVVTQLPIEGPHDLERAAKSILSSLRCDGCLITRGEQGMSLYQQRKSAVHIGATAREVFDVTGAGDTVIATAAFVLAAGGTYKEAAALANQAAGIVVGKLGTATTEPDEILQSLKRI